MQDRFWLRFESGERRGETVPVPDGGLSVGRNDGHGLRIVDKSVSGNHARLAVRGGAVVVADTGSTNGTRVAGERIEERTLAHGDTVAFGQVHLVLLDRELDPELDDRPAEARATADGGEGVRRASADQVARSARKSPVVLLAVLLAVGAGGWFGWKTLQGGDDTAVAPTRPVEPVSGQLLTAAPSFEGDAPERGWAADASAPAGLGVARRWRRSGESGVGATLAAGEWALHRADPVAVQPGRGFSASAHVRAEDGASCRVGLEFLDADGRALLVLWSGEPGAEGRAEVASAPPQGSATAQLLLLGVATSEAGVGFDDAALVAVPAPAAAAEHAEFSAVLSGQPPQAAHLLRVDELVLGGLAWRAPSAGVGEPPVGRGASLSVRGVPTGLAVAAANAPAGAVLVAELPSGATRGGVITTGASGYRVSTGPFEAEGVTSVLFTVGGAGGLVRLGLGDGADVTARAAAGGGLRLEVAGPPDELEVQLAFDEERTRAHTLAAEAREAERRGEAGVAIGLWNELLDRYPYDAAGVREAEERRVRLVEEGLAAVRAVEQEVERARFFALAGLFEECKARALDVAAGYAGTDVEAPALALAAQVDQELALLSFGDSLLDAARLATILSILEEEGSDELAGHVRAALDALQDDGGPLPFTTTPGEDG